MVFSIYFPEYKEIYVDLKAVSGRMVLKEALLHMGLPLRCLVTVCNLFMRMVLAMLKNM